MFVLKKTHEVRVAMADHRARMAWQSENEACARASRLEEANARLREELNKAHEENAKLADLQKPKRDAGAQAFAAIVREAEFARHESVLAYQGHAGEGGIQRHSIGEEYPFIVYGQETRAGVRYRVLDTRNGLAYFNAFSSSRAASALVRRCKDEDKTFTDTGFIISRSK